MIRALLIAFMILVLGLAKGQDNAMTEDQYLPKLEGLRAEYSTNKTIPADVELAALVALSFFPELKVTPIEFMYEKQCEFLITKPRNKLFAGRKKRSYRILMTINRDHDQGMVIDRIAFNALVGVIGHELAHIVDYSQKSVLSTAMTGFRYSTSKQYRANLERATDIATVEHGLGYQLFRIRIYFPEEKAKGYDSYLDREEILDLIKRNQSQSSAL